MDCTTGVEIHRPLLRSRIQTAGPGATHDWHTLTNPIVDDDLDRMSAGLCAGLAREHREVSSVCADVSVLCRMQIEVGGRELPRDDSTVSCGFLPDAEAFAKTRVADVGLHETLGGFHMWQVWTPWLREGTESLERAAARLLAT